MSNLRSIASHVAKLVEPDLRKRSSGAGRRLHAAAPDDRRAPYGIGIHLTPEQGKRVEAACPRRGWFARSTPRAEQKFPNEGKGFPWGCKTSAAAAAPTEKIF
jgi:hypothetical protein